MVDNVVFILGNIDIFINNVGINIVKLVLEVIEKDWN